MSIITEEMKFRHRLCEYAIKNGVTKAARRYHTNNRFKKAPYKPKCPYRRRINTNKEYVKKNMEVMD
ncbi:hypothetical protein [Streptobacillus moniliformis]|uniref:hypothetical protein n=1 Tax=Streptobacillus moniliformis TaxID=34105 RepID=UPI0007E3D376|nr:hypothetical protein [Streptobacillus moniliformis]